LKTEEAGQTIQWSCRRVDLPKAGDRLDVEATEWRITSLIADSSSQLQSEYSSHQLSQVCHCYNAAEALEKAAGHFNYRIFLRSWREV
jgi:hypothetical protein